MDTLQEIRLSDVLTKTDEWTDIVPDRTYRQVTVRLWGKGVVLRSEVEGSAVSSARQRIVHSEQFILSRIDARNGALGLVPVDLDGAIVSNDFPSFHVDQERLTPAYLDWMSKTEGFVQLCQAASEGTTNRVRLQEDRFLAMTISLPPLAEQQRIVARIDALAARIEEAKGLRAQAMAEVASSPSAVHLYYAGNREVELGKVLDLFEDQVPVLSDRSYPQVGIRGFGEGLFDRETLSGHQTSYRYFNRLYLGAVVLSQVKGWEGAIAVCDVEFAGRFASPEYRTFRCREDCVLPEYLKAIVSTPWFLSKLSSITRGIGARRQRVRPEKFLELTVEMPSVDLQRRALPLFEKLDAVKRLQAETQAELDALLPSVLDRAFRGEL